MKPQWTLTMPRSFVAGLALTLAGGAAGATGPEPVSPIGPTSDTCPTFSWSGHPGTEGYELEVHAISPDGKVSGKPALSAWLPAGATSWTPPADACLEAGAVYGWSIRDSGEKSGNGWAEPALIQLAVGPAVAEVESAIATLNRFLHIQGSYAPTTDSRQTIPRHRKPGTLSRYSLPDRSEAKRTNTEPLGPDPGLIAPRSDDPQPGAKTTQAQSAAMKVEGEVRTVDDAGEPRLWGKGRPNTSVYVTGSGFPCFGNDGVKFGLSRVAETWGSAAQICPAGTWVCKAGDVVTCNTSRPDSTTADGLDCAGNTFNLPANGHIGWLAGAGSGGFGGATFDEQGNQSQSVLGCNFLPAWCCWE